MRSASAVRSEPRYEPLPETFENAISAGWTVVSESTALSADEKNRRGKVTLGMQGRSERLSISYTATKAGYQFAEPKVIQ